MSAVHLLDDDERAEGISKAAWQLEDAIQDRLVEEYPTDLKARRLHFEVCEADIDFSRALKAIVVLTIFETPSWCNTDEHFFDYVDPSDRCVIPNVETKNVFLSDVPYIPPGIGLIIEFVLVVFVARKLFLDRKLQTWYFSKCHNSVEYHSIKTNNFGLLMVALNLIDLVIFILFRPRWRLAFIARTGYLCILPQVQSLFSCILAVIDEFYSIASFLVITVVFFAWIAVTIFDDFHEEVFGAPVNKGLDSLRNSVYTMFVAGTTDDFIACFLPSYTLYRYTGLLWFLFLIIVQVLLLNLVLDTLVAAYTTHSEEADEKQVQDKTKGVLKAFTTLALASHDGEEVTKDTFKDFIAEFSASPHIRHISPATAEIVFSAVDEDGSGLIDKHEFLDICKVIEYDFWPTKKYSPVEEHFPEIWNSAVFNKFRDLVETGKFDKFMNYVLLVNLLLVVNESVYDLNGWGETGLMENLELTFSFIYVMEVGLMLSVYSFGEYWSNRSNQFDFFTTWLLLGSSILDELASSSAGANVKRYMNILRLLRLLRVIKQLKRLKEVQFMVTTITTLVTASKDILLLLGVAIYFFSTLSVQLWGGLLYRENPLLEETEYKEKGYFVFNFNDFGTAVGVWWVSLLCEYVRIFPDAIWLVSAWPITWWVFPIFYVTGVSVIFELVKAFTIEMFLELAKARNKTTGELEDETEFNPDVIEKFKSNGLELHYRVMGDVSVHKKMKEAMKELEEEMEEEEESRTGSKDLLAFAHGNPQDHH